MRKRSRGLRLRAHKLVVNMFKWILLRRPRNEKNISCLQPTTKLLTSFANSFRRGVKQLCFPSSSGYSRLGDDIRIPPVAVPKRHMAVYVGELGDVDAQRYVVPVHYFNHPLFKGLLKEAEKVYGFNHPGRIVIPCHASEFEKVQIRIAACTG